jgi:DnaJ-class molecular chaperone
VECRKCHGTGHLHFEDEDDEETVDRDEACYACDGTGYIDCEACSGRGRQDVHSQLGFDNEEQFRDNVL